MELCATEHVHLIYGKGQRREKAITGQFSSLLASYCRWWGAEHSKRHTAGCLSDVIYNAATLPLLSLLFSPYWRVGAFRFPPNERWIHRHHLEAGSHLRMSCWAGAKPGASLEPQRAKAAKRPFYCLLLCNAKFNNNLEAPSNYCRWKRDHAIEQWRKRMCFSDFRFEGAVHQKVRAMILEMSFSVRNICFDYFGKANISAT